jgi:putative addiction module CopG family antidote
VTPREASILGTANCLRYNIITMRITLTPELDRLVQERVASGAYASEEEVLRAALAALDAEEQILAAISEGYADFEAGRCRSFSEANSDFRERHGLPRSS